MDFPHLFGIFFFDADVFLSQSITATWPEKVKTNTTQSYHKKKNMDMHYYIIEAFIVLY